MFQIPTSLNSQEAQCLGSDYGLGFEQQCWHYPSASSAPEGKEWRRRTKQNQRLFLLPNVNLKVCVEMSGRKSRGKDQHYSP